MCIACHLHSLQQEETVARRIGEQSGGEPDGHKPERKQTQRLHKSHSKNVTEVQLVPSPQQAKRFPLPSTHPSLSSCGRAHPLRSNVAFPTGSETLQKKGGKVEPCSVWFVKRSTNPERLAVRRSPVLPQNLWMARSVSLLFSSSR